MTGGAFHLESPLVSTQWLYDHLGADGLAVLDATVFYATGADGRPSAVTGEEKYLLTGHLPGALFADLVERFSDPAGAHPFTRPSAERFAAAAGALGIGPDTTVVVYDDALGQWAARLWWLFRSFGHDRVAVLDGGLKAWVREERPLETGHRAVDPVEFPARAEDDFWIDKDGVEAIVAGDAEGVLLCGSPRAEFEGAPGARPRGGHIPGSVSAPVASLVDRETNTFLPAPALASRFEGLDGAGPVVVYCGAGIAAAADALALALAGRTDVRLYDGSLNEWASDERAPLVAD